MRHICQAWLAQIDITSHCGGGPGGPCLYCSRFTRHIRKDQHFNMMPEFLDKALESLEDWPAKIGIIGGEPTLHPEFEKLCEVVRARCKGRKWVGLFTSGGHKYEQYKSLIGESFDYVAYNDHSQPGKHQPITMASKDVVLDEPYRAWLIDNCWVNRIWCPTISLKGAFFCEVAYAIDHVLDGPGGWPVEKGWWRRTPPYSDQTWACFGAGTMVLMADGRQKPIEEIVHGDRVIDRYGEARSVLRTGHRFAEDVVSVKYRGSSVRMLVTKDHPFLSSTGDFKPIGSWRCVVGRQRSRGDYMVFPRKVSYEGECGKDIGVESLFPGRRLKHKNGRLYWSFRGGRENGYPAFLRRSSDVAYFLGLYCAEGSIDGTNLSLSFHEKEEATLVADVVRIVGDMGLRASVRRKPKWHVVEVRFGSKILAELLGRMCGKGAHNKMAPWFLVGKYYRDFLRGVMAGDGYVAENYVSFGVASHRLAMDVQSMAWGLGIHSYFYAGERPDGRRYWQVVFCGDNYLKMAGGVMGRVVCGRNMKVTFGNDVFVFRKPMEVSEAEPTVVYNIEVEGTHSYIANGVVVHNCQMCGMPVPMKGELAVPGRRERVSLSVWKEYVRLGLPGLGMECAELDRTTQSRQECEKLAKDWAPGHYKPGTATGSFTKEMWGGPL